MKNNNQQKYVCNFWNFSKIPVEETTFLVSCFLFLFLGALVFVGCFNTASFTRTTAVFRGVIEQISVPRTNTEVPKKQEFQLQCATGNVTQTCPTNYPRTQNLQKPDSVLNVTCPSYFRWIHEDLRHWKETGITRDMVESAKWPAHFRLVIVDGKAYVEKYRRRSIQTRDVFSLWGILQLMRWYPGRLPDLELMFDCNDRPVIQKKHFRAPNASRPPLFRYCSNPRNLDIVFPDWSFWGWAETNIKPWKDVLKDIKEGNKRTKWKDRVPYAYWRGNPNVAPTRRDLLKCNVSETHDWNTRLYTQIKNQVYYGGCMKFAFQDWRQESKYGYKQSNLEDQCTHRYKIYIEGWAWSVSEKYILACDAMTLYVTPFYYNFFSRGMVPLQHYWPIRDNSKCTSLQFAVEWGNNHTQEAQAIGEAGSNFIQEDMKMEYIYDYMFHLLNEYAKLLKFKPTIPRGAVELCSETMACPRDGLHKKFMVESLVMSPGDTTPCNLPPPYDYPSLRDLFDKSFGSMRQVEKWEDEYWNKKNKSY
ncbi:hypothetical protein K2173_013281 [Erythroxylum novogranatense]|uniref:Glycosyl transferase CAP10 domain-containing protein n=1 Tax=Erythroxylum novogranatense TaxID=1862640 RepID=A0AAV8S9Z3_9ROSI|nr:hypothetical protein K2173_013281 [Erythroxylum novogranatense]